MRELLIHILTSDPEIRVIGAVASGEGALKFLARKKPDVITMDINMHRMNGFEATRRIMESTPLPIIIVSASWEPKEVEKTFRAMEAGAVAALTKPVGIDHPDYEAAAKELRQTVKLMSEVKMVRRWARLRERDVPGTPPKVRLKNTPADVRLIAIGASTGGPPVLRAILSALPGDFSIPIVVVQHIAAGFLRGLVNWLGQAATLSIHIASNGEHILPGHVYFAPDGLQMGVSRSHRITLGRYASEDSPCPSVSYLFRSVASNYGRDTVGVLLSGMGRDGVEGLRLMYEGGAITIAQNEESSVIHGMPGEAIKLGVATYVLGPDGIAAMLGELARDISSPGSSGLHTIGHTIN